MRVYNKHCSTIARILPGRTGEISAEDYARDPWAFVIEPEDQSHSSEAQNENGSGAEKPPAPAPRAGRQNRQIPAPSSDE